ncbi:MAG: hypothetical protein Q7V88_15110 [Actinomycetota bacterium]|nr:hypothetical protein [Actinomycetota bacterium]
MSASTPAHGLSASATEVLAATIAGAVERQLTQYVAAMAQQVDAARQAVETSRNELRAEFRQELETVLSRLDSNQQNNEGLQRSLQSALETRLGDFAAHQQTRLNEVENRILETPMGGGSIDAGELIALREHIDGQSAAAHARIDELHKATRRFDEQASAMVQHVNDTTIALTQRIDDGNKALATAVEERLGFVRATLESVGPEVQRQLTEHATVMAQRVDFTEHKVTDRMLAMEERVNEQNGTKIAHLEATIGRIGAGFDDAMAALSQRMLELENRLYDSTDRLNALTEQVSHVDDKAIAAMREQLSAAIGEAMLVRIELDRVVATTDEKIDKNSLRMAEIEALLVDEMDVSASVQLERLEELERALAALNPDQFVRRDDPNAGSGVHVGSIPVARQNMGAMPSTSLNPTPPTGGQTTSSEPSLSSF